MKDIPLISEIVNLLQVNIANWKVVLNLLVLSIA